jgi:hypothetical protein
VLCGALAREVIAIARRHDWDVALFGVTASDHMLPVRIAPDVERRLRELIPRFERVVVLYGDCGTSGRLDELLARYNVPRAPQPPGPSSNFNATWACTGTLGQVQVNYSKLPPGTTGVTITYSFVSVSGPPFPASGFSVGVPPDPGSAREASPLRPRAVRIRRLRG